MACEQPDIEALKALLAQARAAYHKLMTGRAAVEITDQNGEKVRFTAAKKQDLYNYILQLEAAICPGSAARANRPMRFVF